MPTKKKYVYVVARSRGIPMFATADFKKLVAYCLKAGFAGRMADVHRIECGTEPETRRPWSSVSAIADEHKEKEG